MPIKPNPIAIHCLIGLCALTLFVTCQTEKTKKQPTPFYDAVLAQIIVDHYYWGVAPAFAQTPIKEIAKEYQQGRIPDEDFRQLLNTLKQERIKVAPKCTITFSPHLGLYYKHIVPEESKKEMRAALFADPEFIKSFNNTTVVDPLFTPSGLTAEDINIAFMDVLPVPQPDRHGRDWYQNDGGTLGISKPIFNRDHTRAIVYQEYVYDGKNGKGMFVFVEEREGEWKVYMYLETWIS